MSFNRSGADLAWSLSWLKKLVRSCKGLPPKLHVILRDASKLTIIPMNYYS